MVVQIDLGVLEFELDEVNLSTFDAAFDEAVRAKKRQKFAEFWESLDVVMREMLSCPDCGGEMEKMGRLPLKIGILSGEVLIRRRRLRCRECGAERYPLDERMGRVGKHTLPVLERALYLATELSYEKASRALKKLTGAAISHGQIQRAAKAEGVLVRKDLNQASADLFELGLDPGERVKRGAEDTVVIAIDGGNIPDRATGADFEAKVGVIYGIKAQVSKNRTALLDRVGYASLENAWEFGKKLFCLARRQGVLSAGRVLAIGDGAAWIRNLIRDYFPSAIYLLDLYHLKCRVSETLVEDEGLREEVVSACRGGDPYRALTLLGTYNPSTPEQAEKLRKLSYYVKSNRQGILNYARSDLFGSGAVEKAVDLLVSRRFKTRGMSWLKPGAAGMLALRLLRFNGEWEAYWQRRIGFAT